MNKPIDDCIFFQIVNGQGKAHIIWSDEKHIAFLSPYPNTKGFTVVITKDHYPSNNFDLPDNVLQGLVLASKKVGKLLDKSFDSVGRTGLIMEGFGVNHVHTKLIPMHGTSDLNTWIPFHLTNTKFFDKYEGYLSSHDCEKIDDNELNQIAELIRKNNIS